MSFIGKLFGKKEKTPVSQCKICKTLLEYNEGYALTTSEVVSSKEYWDHKMVEPETLGYTTAHFKQKDANATKMRGIIFEKTAEKDQTWLVCDTCIKQFEVDTNEAKKHALQWWESKGVYNPPKSGDAKAVLEKDTYEEIKEYATMLAGGNKIR
ncbi:MULTISPECIES: hypothetical protein [unclassified Imperialibacter]|uniref:hypothetical protein n=1 Tax=unclassified Imperialibacter TaxID=2629706 RepID=UPI001259B9E0|nr:MULTISPECIES: hypothetical protein [unclassified Imperialibacter]CAD5273284.1 conserved hypothetical protein [Imperialibacter sp. 89]CAD5288955.1 conserved hypothetical protein [Imperialibacter sp. 75]VVT14328.1 conserved hypothetical protein [Imperialibacter sp. EC-SDR9]